MIESYQKLIALAIFIIGTYFIFFRKKKDTFSEDYNELLNSEKYKVKKPYQ